MPRKNKRKFFGGKSNKNKSAKLDENATSPEHQEQHESDSNESNTKEHQKKKEEEEEEEMTFKNHARASSLTSDSTLGQLDLSNAPDTNVTKMGATMSCAPSPYLPPRKLRWCSEPNLNDANSKPFIRHYTGAGGSQKATITLKFIQFIGEIPKETRDIDLAVDIPESDRTVVTEKNESMAHDTVIENKFTVEDEDERILNEKEELGAMPKFDEIKEDEANQEQQKLMREKRFDDNYRVESPKQISSHTAGREDVKRHAMLIQEISESSSSEEVKNLLDNEKTIMKIESAKDYRVDSPESSDECNKSSIEPETAIVQEITESSSNESLKKDQSLPKVINIKELPSESSNHKNNDDNHPKTTLSASYASVPVSSTSKIKLFECKSEKKLNKAEEAIIEALYGNSNLLQIPNTPLDVISEEGSDCSDIERQNSASKLHSINNNQKLTPVLDDYDEQEDDDVFLSTPDPKFYRHRILQTLNKQKPRTALIEQPKLINTKIIETESNVPESCKSWETKQSDSELQAELVYLTSASSSATDLSERSCSNTDTEDATEDASEDTETNSLLESISVPSLYNVNIEKENNHQEHIIDDCASFIQQQTFDCYQEINEQKLPDILEEEDEEQRLEITKSQQQIEDVNKELHHLINLSTENEKNKHERTSRRTKSDETMNLITSDDKNVINDSNSTDLNNKSSTPTPTQTRRKYSSDSSTSSSNSQCTIIRQVLPIDNNVHALKDLCMQSINEGRITVQKKFNSLSRNAPSIPIINELELHYECDNSNDLQCRENVKAKDKVITILQVPPEMNSRNNQSSTVDERDRWFGMQSSQMPNLMLALSPRQKDYMLNSQQQDTNSSNTQQSSADVLLDMHKKFVERRAYHEEEMSRVLDENIICGKNSDKSRIVNVCQLEESNLSDSNGSAIKIVADESSTSTTDKSTGNLAMDAIRNLIIRESTTNIISSDSNQTKDDFRVKKYELENELKKLDTERKELEEELKNIQSLQHFKREEFLYNEKKMLDECTEDSNQTTQCEDRLSRRSSDSNNTNKYVNDDFNGFINSNEKLHKEIYNEWQDKVCERNERKLQKILKITGITEDNRDDSYSEPPQRPRERAASERIVQLNDEFLEKVKERQKRLSLPLDDNLDASTESLLNDSNEDDGMRKRKKKVFKFVENKENFPAHFREFIEYCEQEIVQTKNSVESGESLKKPLYLGLIGVAFCICGFYIGKHFLTASSKLSP